MGKFVALERAILTKNWPIEERSALAHYLKHHHIAEGDPVFVKGSKDRGLYLIEAGTIRIQYENLNVDLKEGDSFGELSLLEETPKVVSATAGQVTDLWVLTDENFQEMKRLTPAVAVLLVESIAKKLIYQIANFKPPQRTATLSSATGSQPRPPTL